MHGELFPGWSIKGAFAYAGLRWLPPESEPVRFAAWHAGAQLAFDFGKPLRKNAARERRTWESVLKGYSVSRSQWAAALEGAVVLANWIWRSLLKEMELLQDSVYIPECELDLAHRKWGVRPQKVTE